MKQVGFLVFLLWFDGDFEGVLHRWDSIVRVSHLHDVHRCLIGILWRTNLHRVKQNTLKHFEFLMLTLKVRKTLRLAGVSSWFMENALTLTGYTMKTS